MKVFQVTQVTVIKQSESPLRLVIQVMGLAASSGWTNPRLDNSDDPTPADAVLELSFEADRPSGIVLPVITPIAASTEVSPSNEVDAIIVSSRTNSITVHASEFMTLSPTPGTVTTFALGEEDPVPSTLAIGEESPMPTTRRFGEENPITTLAVGEESPITNPRVDDPRLGGGPFGNF